MSAGGTSANIHLGPGRLYYAPLGTTEPTNASSALDAAFKVIGYTEEGTTVSTNITAEDIEVAEELDPVLVSQTSRDTTVALAMVEMTVSKLALAMGAGAATTDTAATFSFPAAGSAVGVMLCWDSDESPGADNRRWLFPAVFPSGDISISRAKAPKKASIPVTFKATIPSGGSTPVKVFPNTAGRI